jgi:hypothetical protein
MKVFISFNNILFLRRQGDANEEGFKCVHILFLKLVSGLMVHYIILITFLNKCHFLEFLGIK